LTQSFLNSEPNRLMHKPHRLLWAAFLCRIFL
jgi:hypothetical protein